MIALALVVLGFVAVAALRDGGTNGDGRGAVGDERRTLSIMGFGTGDEIARTRAQIAERAIAPAGLNNPSGTFNEQQFLAALASGKVPDLIYLDRQKVGSLAARGVLTRLDSFVDEFDVDMSQYRQTAVDEVTFDGELYGIPEFYDNRTIIVNDAVAKEAGVAAEDVNATDWQRLREITAKMTTLDGGKLTRIGFDPKLPEFFPLWAKANGVDVLSKDGRTANLDDPKAIEALAYAVGLIELQGGWDKFKAFRDTWDFFGEKNEFARDQAGAFPMEGWYYNVLASNSPDVEVTAVPFTDRAGKTINWTTGSAWAIPKAAKNPELAFKWAKAMTATDSWVEAAKARVEANAESGLPFTGLYTANRDADREIFDTLYKPISPRFDAAVQTLRDVQEKAFALPPSPAGSEFQASWQEAVNRVLAGQQTPAAALQQAQQQAQAALDAAA